MDGMEGKGMKGMKSSATPFEREREPIAKSLLVVVLRFGWRVAGQRRSIKSIDKSLIRLCLGCRRPLLTPTPYPIPSSRFMAVVVITRRHNDGLPLPAHILPHHRSRFVSLSSLRETVGRKRRPDGESRAEMKGGR